VCVCACVRACVDVCVGGEGDVCCVECRVSSAFGLLASKQHYFDAVLQQCFGRGILVFPLVFLFHIQMLDALYGGNIHTLSSYGSCFLYDP